MWKTVEELIKCMEHEEYVFLRNADLVKNDFSESDDWDILCIDINRIIECMQAIPLNGKNNCFNYYTLVNGKKLLLDIRCVGDGYYDKIWEEDMLNTREKRENYYVLNSENRKFSLLYHCLIQKDSKSRQKYEDDIKNDFGIFNFDDNMKKLAKYMEKKGYYYVKPLDEGVYLNYAGIRWLQEISENGRKN